MKHHKKTRSFGRTSNQRKALIKSLSRALVMEEKIETSEAKARELRPVIEKMITKAKAGTLAGKRTLIVSLGVDGAKKIEEIAPRYKDRTGDIHESSSFHRHDLTQASKQLSNSYRTNRQIL